MRFLAPLALLGLALFATTVPAEEPAPNVLFDAAQCLATSKEDWLSLGHRRATDLEMGYIADPKSFGGQQMLYVVDYSSPLHTAGTVSAFALQGKLPQLTLSLQFVVHFQQSGDGLHTIHLVNPPFGGIGTQQRVISSIRQVGLQTWTIPVESLVTEPNQATCESDAPNQ